MAALFQLHLCNMNTFFKTLHCQSRAHCPTCRWQSEEGYKWRASIAEHYGVPSIDFECPEGKPWESELKQPVTPKGKMLRAAGGAIGKVFGGKKVSDEVLAERTALCLVCDLLIIEDNQEWCGELIRIRFGATSKKTKGCGCLLDKKRLYANFACPRGLWS